MTIEIGRTYRHPRNGSEVVVLRDDPDGYEIELRQQAGIGRTRPHVHLDFEQDFEVLEGVARMSVDGSARVVPADETVHLPRGTGHVDPWNAGPDRLVFRNRIAPTPPFIQAYVETVIAALVDGRLSDAGELPFLHIAVVHAATRGESFASGPPVGLQRRTLPLVAALGRMRGYAVENVRS